MVKDSPIGTPGSVRETLSALRDALPRIYELKSRLKDASHPDAYFQNFEDSIEKIPGKREAFLRLERLLEELDNEAWADLKERAAPHLISRTRASGRGWQALFDIVDSEARGFAYLKSIGCMGVHFVKPTKNKMPDLIGVLNRRPVLCEVKTINISDHEAEKRRRIRPGAAVAGRTSGHLDEGFLKKLGSILENAVEQLGGQDPRSDACRMVFIVVHFDDWVGDYQPEYFAQIDEHLQRNPAKGVELVFCPATNLFQRTFTMKSAVVVNF